ncbi:hypothetical protein VTK56DRAFT_3063 [Thermocarpiscus australiensis]
MLSAFESPIASHRPRSSSAHLISIDEFRDGQALDTGLEADIQTEELQRALWNLNKITHDNGASRAFGKPGYEVSLDFAMERAQTRFRREMDTSSGDGARRGQQQHRQSDVQPAEKWEEIDATGKLALVKRRVCAVADKVNPAEAHGALGVLLYNQEPGTDIAIPTLGADNISSSSPLSSFRLRSEKAGKTALRPTRETWNIIAETKQGDPDSIIMLGAHLDSVQQGPGVNDDGSGTAALLEIMTSVENYGGFPRKIRFVIRAWWSADESGLLGSLYYTSHLSESEADRIKYYFSYDKIGSPSPVFAISSDENSGIGPQLLEEYLVSQGLEVEHGEFGRNSDHVGFLGLGIPAAGLFTGAGRP